MTVTLLRMRRTAAGSMADPAAQAGIEAEIAQARAAQTRAEIDRARALAELDRDQAAARRAAEADAARQARQARRERDQERRAERAERRQRRAAAARTVAGRVRLLVPLLVVNAAAVYGQIAYAYTEIAPPSWPLPARLALAVLFASAVESVAVYVGWHAHDALLSKATATAARLRRASYVIAAGVAAINYAHFAGPMMAPSAASVAFGLLSLLSPWLWGMHTRRVQHVQLLDEGAVDCTGAVFSAERVRAFPIRSWQARRWSIDHNITDPVEAWTGYNAERAARRTCADAKRAARRDASNRAGGDASRPPADTTATAESTATDRAPDAPVDATPATRSPLRPRPHTPRRPPSASKVERAAARMPGATVAAIAAKAGVSESTARRYLPVADLPVDLPALPAGTDAAVPPALPAPSAETPALPDAA